MKALIVIDMVQAYALDIHADKKVVGNQLVLIDAFRKKKLPVIVALPGKGISGKGVNNPIMRYLWGDELKGDAKRKPGKKLADLIPELQAVIWDKTVGKPEYSAFYDTDFAAYCKRKGITELYLCGIYSSCCVHYTGVDAAYRRIWPILVTDASTSRGKKQHLEYTERFAKVIGKTTTTRKALLSI
jgi:maleamate amidohydrolase